MLTFGTISVAALATRCGAPNAARPQANARAEPVKHDGGSAAGQRNRVNDADAAAAAREKRRDPTAGDNSAPIIDNRSDCKQCPCAAPF